MNELISILIKSSLSIALLYLIYTLFLKRDTFFKTNRIYLLLTMIISLIIPFIDFSSFISRGEIGYTVLLDPVIISATGVQASVDSNPGVYQILLAIYLTGMSIFTIRFIYQLWQLFSLVRKFGVSRKEGMNIVFTDRTYSPFSFFNLVFLNNDNIHSSETQKILAHEKVHIRQWHSMDLILLEILTIIQWFNPFVWFYRHAIKTLHEYLADEGVIHSGVDLNVYSALLFEQSTGIQINDLTNNFSKSLLKRRFKMMTKEKSTQIARLKLLLVAPLAMALLLALSFSQEVMAQGEKVTPQKEKEVTQPGPDDPPPPKKIQVVEVEGDDKSDVPIFTVVEEMPSFPGGQEKLYAYLGQNIKYPDDAKEKGIQGKVFVTYVVEKDGTVSHVKILRGVHKSLDDEAVRVIKAMPKWKPGKQDGKPVRVQYSLPIKFTLDKAKKAEEGKEK